MQIGEDLHDPASNASNTINNINNISNINRSITSLLLLLMIVFQTANTIIIIIIIHLEIISIIFIDFYCFQFEMIWKTNRRRWREKPHRLISDTPSGRYQPSNLNLAPSVRSGCCSSSGSQVNGGRGLAATGMVAGWWRPPGGAPVAPIQFPTTGSANGFNDGRHQPPIDTIERPRGADRHPEFRQSIDSGDLIYPPFRPEEKVEGGYVILPP